MEEFKSKKQCLEYLKEKQKDGYKFCIYGAGKNCINEITTFNDYHINEKVEFIVDGDKNKSGPLNEDYKIIHIDEFLELNEKYIVLYSLSNHKFVDELEDRFNSKNSETILIKVFKEYKTINDFIKNALLNDSDLKININKMQYIGSKPTVVENVEYCYKDGQIKMLDKSSETLNIVDGKRLTENYTSVSKNPRKIKMFGDSRFFNGLLDKYTISSFLQLQIGESYKVENLSIRAMNIFDVYKGIVKEELNKGDIVVVNSTNTIVPNDDCYKDLNDFEIALLYLQPVFEIKKYLDSINIDFIFVWTSHIKELSNYDKYEKTVVDIIDDLDLFKYPNFGKVDEGEIKIFPKATDIEKICNAKGITIVNTTKIFENKNYTAFINAGHYTTIGSEKIAEGLAEIIKIKDYNKNLNKIETHNKIAKRYSEQYIFKYCFYNGSLESYIQSLKDISKDKSENAGSIVVNANPFTKGHKYLLEQAAKQVDVLYVFVVEEDKSFFKFKDRFELVKRGSAHIENVIVIPSGKAIISSITMPQYFEKENDVEQVLDASNDIAMFGNLIAPACKISKRFVGNEPYCKTTAQYNNQMKEQLSQYDIDLVIIDRTTTEDNDIISATKVRKYLKERDFKTLEKYVPETTLEFLKENY